MHLDRTSVLSACFLSIPSLALFASMLACAPGHKRGPGFASLPAAGTRPCTYVVDLSVVAVDDSSCAIAWVDQDETRFRAWVARCSVSSTGEIRWLDSQPESLAIPTETTIRIVKGAGTTGIAYLSRGTLLFRPNIERDSAVVVNPDSDYVRNFSAVLHGGTLSVVCVGNVSQGIETYIDALAYDLNDQGLRRQQLARLWLTAGWPIPAPSLRADPDSMRLAIGLDHGGFEYQARAGAPESQFLFNSRLHGSSADWPPPTRHARNPELSRTSGPQIHSFAAFPGPTRGAILSNGGLHLLRNDNATFTELSIGSREASGDAYGHTCVASETLDDSTLCVVWIDAERQMLSGNALGEHGRSSTFYGGDIKYARLNVRRWELGPVHDLLLPKGGTAEALTMTRVGSQFVVVWAGPMQRIAATDQRQFVSAATIQP